MSRARGPATKLLVMDRVADATLTPASWARYKAYRRALIADGQNSQQVVETLSLFLWDLVDGLAANGVH